MKRVLGLDIGGANLKLAHSQDSARTVPFELWKHPDNLPAALRDLMASAPPFDVLAVTMTGELCDCFETKRDGVHAILDAVKMACQDRSVLIWRNDGEFVDIETARESPYQTAAANWLALATFVARFTAGPALLLDIGSTTTDIIPINDGAPIPQGRNDPARLLSGELVYRGVRRTPICCVRQHRLAAELFATTLDAFLLLGEIPESESQFGTADGRPATRLFAHARMARMLGSDGETCPHSDTLELAQATRTNVIEEITSALREVTDRLPARPETVVVSGSGEFLARQIIERGFAKPPIVITFSERFGPERASAACAYAVAVLAAERSDGR